MSRIFFDTNLFIYLFEDSQGLGAQVARLISRMVERNDTLITSTMTLGEVLVKPMAMGDDRIAARYRSLLLSKSVVLSPFDADAAIRYAEIRQDRSIRPPDAIQLACAAAARCDLVVSNDKSLMSKTVPGVQFIVPLDRVPL